MARPHSLFSDINSALGGDDNSTVASSSRPMSSAKQPSFRSNSNDRKSGSRGGDNKSSSIDIDTYTRFIFRLSREDLISELQENKRKNIFQEQAINNLKAENQRLERELVRQQMRLDKLLEASVGSKSALPAEWRRDTEKSLIVRQLKRQVYELRQELEAKENELQAEKKSVKSSNILALAYERDEYLVEVQRLQKIVKDLKNELRQVTIRDTVKYKSEEDSTLRESDQTYTSNRVSSKKLVEIVERKINVPEEPLIPSVAPKQRPTSSQRRRRPKSQAGGITGVPNSNVVIAFEDFKLSKEKSVKSKKVKKLKGQIEKASEGAKCLEEEPAELVDDHRLQESRTSPPHSKINTSSNKPHSSPTQSEDKDLSSLSPNQKLHPDTPFKANVSTLASAASTPSVKSNRSSNYNLGELIEAKHPGLGQWLRGRVISFTDDSVRVHFIDDDEEFDVNIQYVRRLTGVTVTIVSKSPTDSTGKKMMFKPGDKVFAQYYNGTTWYKGIIKASHDSVEGEFYDVLYDDGERENKISVNKIKLQESEPVSSIQISPNSKATTPKSRITPTSERETHEKKISVMVDILPQMSEDSVVEDFIGTKDLQIGGAVLDDDIDNLSPLNKNSKTKHVPLAGYLNDLSESLSLGDSNLAQLDPFPEIISPSINRPASASIKTSRSVKSVEYADDFDA